MIYENEITFWKKMTIKVDEALLLPTHVISQETHWGRDKIAPISQMPLSNLFSCMEITVLYLNSIFT